MLSRVLNSCLQACLKQFPPSHVQHHVRICCAILLLKRLSYAWLSSLAACKQPCTGKRALPQPLKQAGFDICWMSK